MQGTVLGPNEWRGRGISGQEAMTQLVERTAKNENPYYEIINRTTSTTEAIASMIGQTKAVFICVPIPLSGGGTEITFMKARKRADIERWLNERIRHGWANIWVVEHSRISDPVRTEAMFIQPIDGV